MKISQFLPSLESEVFAEYDEDHKLAYFRGIPYATVKERWTHSEVLHTLETPFDATSFGRRCVQEEGQVLVSGGTNDPTPGDDEFSCLNLNITVPKECLRQFKNGHTRSKVPVMFWIHGGAFKYGANSVARYRPHKLCSMAQKDGNPIILVQIGYRLGALGFAASNDLECEQRRSHESNGANEGGSNDISGNYGFVDQRNALKWVQKHIHDFGGDAANVTAFGISAGSASVHHHILTGDPMFDRGICMSGSAPTLGPLPFEIYEKAWQNMCQRLGIAEEDPKERLKALRKMDALEILRNYSSAAMGPMADGTILPKAWTFEDSNVTRCQSLIVGDTNVEAIILDGLFKSMTPSHFQRILRSVISNTEADEFCQLFGLTGDDQPWESYRDSMRRFLSLMMFQFPNLRIAETFNTASQGKAYLYHFEEQSPFPGPTKGLSYHGQCALYMYGVENDNLPHESQQVAYVMAQMWIAFAYGIAPWEDYTTAERFMRFGPEGKTGLMDCKQDETRQYNHTEWLKQHFESLKQVARMVLNKE